ncbi:MAG TPA: ribonucleotide reductase N-terminal alpha domain-containing protein, partial [Sphingomicrobium sp.]|nr:ribonucleotide reductase N-terminal alpha domain-containing protein [Sphingomicrobium sp.]
MDFSTGSEVSSDDVSTTTTVSGTNAVHAPRFDVKTDPSRDELLTEFGKETLRDRYLLPGESYQDLFARVAAAYADDEDHAQRVY